MFKKTIILFTLLIGSIPCSAQQNWAAVNCYNGNGEVSNLFIDSLNNELILSMNADNNICNVPFKNILAYNGNSFRTLDGGFNTNLSIMGSFASNCITYNGKSLYGGFFNTAGSSNTVQAVSLALWNGNKWESFPKPTFNLYKYGNVAYNLNSVYGFLKDNGKLWIYGEFDTLGGVPGKNLYTFDGSNYTYMPLPVTNNSTVTKMVKYKNQLYAAGLFYNYPSFSISKLIKYDGVNWTSVGNGTPGNFGGVWDMVEYNDTLYLAGSFSKADGNVGNYIMKWDGTQLMDAGFGGFYNWGIIYSLVKYKNRLYAFGTFDHVADKKINSSMAYYEKGKWVASPDSQCCGITKAVVYKDAIYIAGGFDAINGDPSIKYFARLQCPDFDAATGCLSAIKENSQNRLNLKVFPNPTKDKLTIEADYTINIEKLSITNALGQQVFSLLNVENKHELDISFLPSGIYFLKAQNKQGQSVFKIIKE